MLANAKTPIELAMMIAEGAHQGQVDKAGKPYVRHPSAVASIVEEVPSFASLAEKEKTTAVAAAWLHDALEDSPLTVEGLTQLGMPDEVIETVSLLTHIPPEPRADYYERLKGNRVARIVKLADVAHNVSPVRLLALDDATRSRLQRKYAVAADTLIEGDAEAEWFEGFTQAS